MKKYTILLFFIYGISFSQDFSQQITAPKHTKDRKYVFLSGGIYFQFAGNINRNLKDTYADIEEIVNTQILYYDLKIRLYKNLFVNYKQGFSIDPKAYEEYNNTTGDLIEYEDDKVLYIRNSISLQYYFKIKNNTFNLSLGYQDTGNNYNYARYVKVGNYYVPITLSLSDYDSKFIGLGYSYRNFQINAGYHFGGTNEMEFYSTEYSLSMYYLSFSYRIHAW